MTVRNIRAHQSRGLLPPPEVKGRTGYYGPEHEARVELIKELQADGYNLDLIRRLIEGTGGSSAEVLRFTRAVRAPFSDEEPQFVDAAELAERWDTNDPELLQKAVELGLFRDLGDGRFEELSPRLGRAGQELVELGIPIERALEVVARLRRNADSAARTFAKLFIDSVWRPFDEAGRPGGALARGAGRARAAAPAGGRVAARGAPAGHERRGGEGVRTHPRGHRQAPPQALTARAANRAILTR